MRDSNCTAFEGTQQSPRTRQPWRRGGLTPPDNRAFDEQTRRYDFNPRPQRGPKFCTAVAKGKSRVSPVLTFAFRSSLERRKRITPWFSYTHWVPFSDPLFSMSYWEIPSFLTSFLFPLFIINNLFPAHLPVCWSDQRSCLLHRPLGRAGTMHGENRLVGEGTVASRTFISTLAYINWLLKSSRQIVGS